MSVENYLVKLSKESENNTNERISLDEHDVDHHEMVDLELPLQTAQGEGININEFLSNQINNPG